MAVTGPGGPTVVVLTALPVEMVAVLARVEGDRSAVLAGPVVCEVGGFRSSGGVWWQVVAAELGSGGLDTAGAVVTLAGRFGPEVLMFAGIAGALEEGLAVGDVVAGSEVAWTERGRWGTDGFAPRVRTVSLSVPLCQLARKVAREGGWTARLTRPRPGARAVVGQIASGEKVVADGQYRAWLRAVFPEAVAIEMEGFALARAGEAHAAGQRCVVRGISDHADGAKSDAGHADAADAAAAFAFELLDAYSAQAYGSRAGGQAPAGSQVRTGAVTEYRDRQPDRASAGALAGHVFLSYVRQDQAAVGRLRKALESSGVRVWQDTIDLLPGQERRAVIRRAVTDGALVFIACFSRQGLALPRSHQYEELTLAAEQIRARRPDVPWLIPVRLDDCDLPDLDLGASRSLESIHPADLFGERYEANLAALITVVRQILGQ